jgi:hypothetical protein
VDYASSDGSATVVSDYTGSSGTLTFGPGVTSRTLTVPIVRDAVHEASETLLLRLSDATGPGSALEAQHTAVVTILDNDPAPLLQFGAPRYAVKEGSGAATLTVRRVGSRANEATVDYATKDGTAQAGADFAQATGTLTFGTDVVTQTLAIPIVDDPNPEASETLDVTLGNPQPGSGATLGNLTATRVTITDNDQGLQFSAASYMAAESAPRAVIAVRRSGGTTGTLTVDYAVTGGTATGGSDYSLAPGTLSFGPGQALRTFAVTILNDADAEGSETVELALSGYSPPTAQGALGTAVLTITDTEPVFQFSAGTYPVPEKAPRAVITVRRTGPTTGDAKVDYTVSDGTAQAAIDYTSASTGTLSFGAGRATQTLSIGVIDDAEDEPSETLQLVLQNPSAGCGIGTPGSALLTISDNDVAGRAQFSAGAFSQAEDGGSVTITVTRATGTSGMATVHYVATPGAVNPGVPGTDYQPAAGTLTFGPGDTSQSFEVVVLDDVVADGARSVALTLSEPGGGLVLGARSAAVLWLVDDE